jgi:hypothetical protein
MLFLALMNIVKAEKKMYNGQSFKKKRKQDRISPSEGRSGWYIDNFDHARIVKIVDALSPRCSSVS